MPLSRASLQVLRGLLRLTNTDRQEVLSELTKFLQGTEPMRKSITESVERAVDLGPTNSVCSCCGR